jgi:hypothetical protein
MVASYVRERERIFLRWLENVERLLDRPVDHDAPSRRGATATPFANMPVRGPCPLWPRADQGALKDPEAVMVESAGYAAPVILLAIVFVMASTRPAR